MPRTELPAHPVVAWRESHSPWWVWPSVVLSFAGFENKREVAVSANGISISGTGWGKQTHFVPWDEVVRIDEAPAPDLARIVRRDGEPLLLDRRHLPFPCDEATRRERIDLLRRALATSRERDA